VTGDLPAEVRLELGPPRREPGGVHVLGARDRGDFTGELLEGSGRDRHSHPIALLLEVADRAEPRDEEPREVAEEAERGRERRGDLDGSEMEEPSGRAGGEGSRDGLGGPGLERRGVRILEEAQPSRGGDREREAVLRLGWERPVTGHLTTGAGAIARERRRC